MTDGNGVYARHSCRSTGPQKAADFTKFVTQLQNSDFFKDVSFGLRHRKDTSSYTFAAKDLHIE